MGIPTSGRRYADLDKIIGMFVNTIALRSFPEQTKVLSVFLNEIKNNVIGALEHQDYPFDELVQKLNLSKTNHKSPLFEVMFQMQRATPTKFSLPKSEITILDINLTSDFKMTFSITEYDEKLIVKIIYRKDLFDRETMQQFLKQFEGIYTDICSDITACIGDIGGDMTDQTEVHGKILDIQFHFD